MEKKQKPKQTKKMDEMELGRENKKDKEKKRAVIPGSRSWLISWGKQGVSASISLPN